MKKLLIKMFEKDKDKYQTIGWFGALLLALICLFIGTVFTVGMQYWNKSVKPQDCERVSTQFVSYEKNYGRGKNSHHLHEIDIKCADGREYTIDGSCLSKEVISKVSALKKGDNITLLLHPKGDQIIEFCVNNSIIMEFDESMSRLRVESNGFFIFGIFLYGAAVLFILIFIYLFFVNKDDRLYRKRLRKEYRQ